MYDFNKFKCISYTFTYLDVYAYVLVEKNNTDNSPFVIHINIYMYVFDSFS